MRIPGGSSFLASGRAAGLGASVLLHGAALAAVVSLEDAWPRGAAPVTGVAIPVIWQETAIPTAPAPVPASSAPPLAGPKSASRPAPPDSRPAETRPAETRKTTDLPRPPAARPSPRPVSEASAASQTDANPVSKGPVSEAGSGQADSPAVTTRQTSASPAEPAAATQPPQQSLAAVPASSVVGWAVIARAPPTYPAAARRRGAEGEVLLRAEIGTDGAPASVVVLQGSGDVELDAAAVAAVEKWRFRAPGRFTVEIPIVFRLDNRSR